jgi:hypothetical protein
MRWLVALLILVRLFTWRQLPMRTDEVLSVHHMNFILFDRVETWYDTFDERDVAYKVVQYVLL